MKHDLLFNSGRGLLTRLVLFLTLLLGGATSAWADELTVYGSSTNTIQQVPLYGALLDVKHVRSEFIIPGKELTSMNGKNITQLEFTTNKAQSFSWGDAEFNVYLKEVSDTIYSTAAFKGGTDSTLVYQGSLSILSGKMRISFPSNRKYLYNGGNLLIGICCTKTGTSTANYSYYFYGYKHPSDYTAYYSVYYGSNSTTVSKGVIKPRTTFTYETPVSKTISALPNEDAEFGEVYESKNKVYRITNNGSSSINVTPSITGTNASSFSVLPSIATAVSAGGYQDFTFTFNYDSNSLGGKSATLTFTPSDGDYNTIEFDATATAIDDNAPELAMSPSEAASFGTVKADASKTYTVTNSGTGSMTVNIESNNATEFSVSKDQIILGAGESTTFDVTFNFDSSRSGDRNGIITVTPTYNEEDAVAITTTATAITQPIIGVSSTYATMGSLKVNGTREITVSNTGYGDMEVDIKSSNETFFTVSPSSLTVAQDESETFTITFHYDPDYLGYKTSTITVTPTYDVDAKKTITASATAVEPLFISPDVTTSFGNVTGNASRTYTVTNLGTSAMDVEMSLGGTNPTFFSLSETSFSAIPAGESRTFTATFNYDSESTGSMKSASIIVTPTGSSNTTSVNINATPQNSGYEDITIDEANYAAIAEAGTKKVKVKYSAKSGWNTFCVPFGMSEVNMNIVFGSGCKYYVLDSYNSSSHELTFTTSAIAPSAGVPLLVYTESAPTYTDGVILIGRYVVTSDANKTSKNGATFQGTYAPIAAGSFTTDMYGVTTAGEIRPGNGTTAFMKGYRAYFTGISAPTSGAGVKMIILEDDGGETDLGFVKMVDENAKDVYTLTGQKVQKGRKGIYIVNGKKVVIR